MKRRKRYRVLSLSTIDTICEDLFDSLDMKWTLAPLMKDKCPYFYAVKDSKGHFRLLYAEVANRFDLDLEYMQRALGLFQRYGNGELTVEDCGLDSFQVYTLIGFEYGITAVLNVSTSMVEVAFLQSKNNSKEYGAKKESFAILPLGWDE